MLLYAAATELSNACNPSSRGHARCSNAILNLRDIWTTRPVISKRSIVSRFKEMGSLGIPQVPTFALGDLLSRKHEQSFHDCLREIGAFYVTGVDIDHTTPRHSVQNFFKNATEEEKEAMSLPDSKLRRGFTALGSESTSRITSTGNYVDYSMCYSMGVGSNLFPNAEFQRSWNVHFDEVGRYHEE